MRIKERTYMTIEESFKKHGIHYPSDDFNAYISNVEHCHMYDRMFLSQYQGIECYPMGIYPSKYPVISKPIINLFGFSKGFRIIRSKEEYDIECKKYPGHFWQTYLEGTQYNVDCVLRKGKILHHLILKSKPCDHGLFEYHQSIMANVPSCVKKLIKEKLHDYTGLFNAEVICNKVTECHLRLNGDNMWYTDNFFQCLSTGIENIGEFPMYTILHGCAVPIFDDSTVNKSKLYNQKLISKIHYTPKEDRKYLFKIPHNVFLKKILYIINGKPENRET